LSKWLPRPLRLLLSPRLLAPAPAMPPTKVRTFHHNTPRCCCASAFCVLESPSTDL
jgi:hypothetical protein